MANDLTQAILPWAIGLGALTLFMACSRIGLSLLRVRRLRRRLNHNQPSTKYLMPVQNWPRTAPIIWVVESNNHKKPGEIKALRGRSKR